MVAVFVLAFCFAFAIPFTVMAWAMKRTHCPNCGAEIGPDPEILRVLEGR